MTRNILHHIIILCSIFLFSCDNTNDIPLNIDKSKDIEIINGNTLKFKNEKVYAATLNRLINSSQNQKEKFLDSLSFQSQFTSLNLADLELNNICETDNKEAFKKNYLAFKQKYENVFMFNNLDIYDLSPYSKLINSENELFANEQGIFFIGDSLVKCNEFTSFENYYNSQVSFTKGASTAFDQNHAWSEQGKRKVGLYISLASDRSIYVQFTAQKKNMFGWVRYSTEYYAKFNISPAWPHFELFECRDFGFAQDRFVPKNNVDFQISTIELGGNTTVKLGRALLNGAPAPISPTVTGKMEVWSRGIDYNNRGLASIYLGF